MVGVAAPASCFDDALFRRGLATLKALGHPVKVPDGVFRRNGYLAGTDEERARVLTDLFLDPEVRAVFAVRGGFGAMRMLPLLDYGLLKRNPKILVGFSDITALLCAVLARSGFAVFHGPVLTSLARDAEKPLAEIEAIEEAVRPDKPLALAADPAVVIREGRAEGPVYGGNLTLLAHLVGTPYLPDLSGAILFIEDHSEAPYRIDRKLTHLALGGCLDKIAGVAAGAFCQCGGEGAVFRVLEEAFAPLGVPVLAGFPAGHGPRNLAFPLGVPARLDTASRTLTFLTPATVEANHGDGPTAHG